MRNALHHGRLAITKQRLCTAWQGIAPHITILFCLAHLAASKGLGSVKPSDTGAGRRLLLSHAGEFVANDPIGVPSFIIIGAGKGGTTDLFAQLTALESSDPDRPDPPLRRGKHKETRVLHGAGLTAANFTPNSHTFRQYLDVLRHPCANEPNVRLRDCLAAGSPSGTGGGTGALAAVASSAYSIDATPDYHMSPTVPLLLRGISPDAKVVLLLREPVDRAEAMHYFLTTVGKLLNTTMDELVTDFFRTLASSPEATAILGRLASCPAAADASAGGAGDAAPGSGRTSGSSSRSARLLRCQAAGWQDLVGLDLVFPHEYKLFMAGLYGYSLAAWRLHFFQPGRLMVIDSHVYFRDRVGVMEQVIAFLYGRTMTAKERELAQDEPVKNARHRHNATSSLMDTAGVSSPPPAWMLSPANRARLQELYDAHMMGGLHRALEELKEDGAWIVGFDTEPWPWATAPK